MLSDLLMYKSEFIFEVQSGGWSTTKFFDCVRFYSLVPRPGNRKSGYYQSQTAFYAACLSN